MEKFRTGTHLQRLQATSASLDQTKESMMPQNRIIAPYEAIVSPRQRRTELIKTLGILKPEKIKTDGSREQPEVVYDTITDEGV